MGLRLAIFLSPKSMAEQAMGHGQWVEWVKWVTILDESRESWVTVR